MENNMMHKINEKTLTITGARLLAVEEAAKLLNKKQREYHIYNKEGEQHSWWWLGSPGSTPSRATYVLNDGTIDERGDVVDYNDNYVRPVLIIESVAAAGFKIGDDFVLGGKCFEIISETLALIKTDIGCCRFRRDSHANDANLYEKSDVKKYIDEWFESLLQKCSF